MAEADLRLLLRTIADTSGAEKTSAALRRVQDDTKRTSAVTQQLTTDLVSYARGYLSVAAAATAFGSVLASSINAQRESERITRVTAAAYGANAQQFERFATALSQQTGFTKQAILQAALSARTLSDNYGLTIQQTQKLIAVSADLARVRGIGVAEAFERVQSAIRGEAEASEYLGLTLNDTFIKNNAMNGSLKTTFERMTDAEKAQIRLNEVLRQSAKFSGLAADSMNTLDGSFARAEASANRLALALGKITGPAAQYALDSANQAFKDLAITLEVISKKESTYADLINAIKAGTEQPSARRAREAAAAAVAARTPTARTPDVLVRDDMLLTPAAREQIQRGGASATERAAIGRTLDRERQLQTAREVAYLDQRDAAIRDLLAAQREEVALKEQLARMEKEHGDMTARRLQLELASISAQQRAMPAQMALQDTERAIERARLVLGIRGTSAADRAAARAQIRDLTRNVAPGQRLAAFDVETGVIGAQRQQTAFDLAARVAAIGREQAIAGQQVLIDAAIARTDAQNQVLGQIIQQAITDGFVKRPPTQIRIQVLTPEGEVSYEELIEANDQAQTPPVIRVSGVRR